MAWSKCSPHASPAWKDRTPKPRRTCVAAAPFNHAFRHMVDRLNTLVASLSFTMELRKARVAFALMRTYVIMKSLARHPDSASMLAHVENVRRDLGRRNPGRRSAEPPPNEPEADIHTIQSAAQWRGNSASSESTARSRAWATAISPPAWRGNSG